MADDLSFGQWLKRQRRLLDLTQEELATRLGYAVTTIRRLESDDMRPSKELADKLAVMFDLPAGQRSAFLQFARGMPSAAPLSMPLDRVTLPSTPGPPTPLRHNLPLQVSSFIGREREVAAILALLARNRLVTLTGAGGTGKTRLALQVAEQYLAPPTTGSGPSFTDGITFVDLAPLADVSLVVAVIAQTLGVREAGQRPLFDALKDYLRPQRRLLLLDNFEHVLDATPRLTELLAVAPYLTILVTSRVALNVRGEQEYPVPPLALPDRSPTPDHSPAASRMTDDASRRMQSEAERLFVERMRAIKPDLALDEGNVAAIAAICTRLDGLPLAIELAAARGRVYTPQAILQRLVGAYGHTPLQFLTGGPRDLPPRQQTLRTTIDWSYRLLSAEEQTLFRRLSVFAGGFALPAAEAVAGPIGAMQVVDGVEALAAKSLLKQVEGVDGEPRFTLLETLREYALEQLLSQGETEATRQRHAEYFLALAEEGEWGLHGPAQRVWLNRLEMEHDNIRAALSWYLAAPDGGLAAQRLASAMQYFWWLHSHLSEGYHWLSQTLAHPAAQARTVARANALFRASRFAPDDNQTLDWREQSIAMYREVDDPFGLALALRAQAQAFYLRGQTAKADPLMQEAHALFRSVGHPHGLGLLLEDEGNAAISSGDYVTARVRLEESAAMHLSIGDRWMAAASLSHIGFLEHRVGNFAAARRFMADRIAVIREIGTRSFLSLALSLMGQMMMEQGDYASARAIYTESLALAEEWRDKIDMARASYGLGIVNHRQGDLPAARAHLSRSLVLYRELGRYRPVAFCLLGLADVEMSDGQRDHAARLCGAARHHLHLNPPAVLLELRYHFQRDIDALLAQLTDPPSLVRLADGAAMSLDQAIAYALSIVDSTDAQPWPGLP